MKRLFAVAIAATSLSACATIPAANLPATPGERSANYGYIPLDPLTVDQTVGSDSCPTGPFSQQGQPQQQGAMWADITESLPDFSVRYAIAQFSRGGGLQFGPTQSTIEDQSYRAVLDYTNVDVVPVEFLVRKKVEGRWFPLSEATGRSIEAYEAIPKRAGNRELEGFQAFEAANRNQEEYSSITFPVYVGIGLRLSADILALESKINLSGLSVIGAEANANNLTGTLTIQTIGLAGGGIGNTLPLPSKLDQTTIENSILAIGTTRALVYNDEEEQIIKTPRVLGLYSPVGSDPALINAVYSALSEQPIPWQRPCS